MVNTPLTAQLIRCVREKNDVGLVLKIIHVSAAEQRILMGRLLNPISAVSLLITLIFPMIFLLMLFPNVAASQSTIKNLDSKQINQNKLEKVNGNLEKIKQRQQALQNEILGFDKDIGAINRALIEAAKRGHDLEASVARSEVNLRTLEKAQMDIKSSLRSKRALLGEVLAALQRMSRKPPPALLVRPEDALNSVRSAILLGAVLPEIRGESDTLFAELHSLDETTHKIEQQKLALVSKLNALANDEARLTLLVKEKNKLTQRSKTGLLAEQKQALKLARKADRRFGRKNKIRRTCRPIGQRRRCPTPIE